MNEQSTIISINTEYGIKEVSAVAIGDLAYHHNLTKDGTPLDTWGVTHIASGLKLQPKGLYFRTPQACKQYIEQILPLTDWSQSAESLLIRYGRKAGNIRDGILSAFYLAKEQEDMEVSA